MRYLFGGTAATGATTLAYWLRWVDGLFLVAAMAILFAMWVVSDGPADRTTNTVELIEAIKAKPRGARASRTRSSPPRAGDQADPQAARLRAVSSGDRSAPTPRP